MYEKNEREINKIKAEQEHLDLYNTVLKTVFLCQKDIVCKRGTFKKNSPVLLEVCDGRIKNIYDITNWAHRNETRFEPYSYFGDDVVVDINKRNFDEYFKADKILSSLYAPLYEEKEKADSDKDAYSDYRGIDGWYAAASALFSILFFLMGWQILGAISVLGFLGATIRAIYRAYMFKHTIKKFEKIVKETKAELKEVAINSEYYSGSYLAHLSDTLVALAQAYPECAPVPKSANLLGSKGEYSEKSKKVSLEKQESYTEIDLSTLRKIAEYVYVE